MSEEGMDFALVLGAFVGARVHVPRRGWPRAGPRRSACGDAVNAAVAEWIGRRLGRCAAAAARR